MGKLSFSDESDIIKKRMSHTSFVGARLSRSGQASAQPGDIQAVSEPFVPAEQNGPMHLMIREIVGQ